MEEVQVCQDCGGALHEGICSFCIRECADCGETGHRDNLYRYDGDWYCRDCVVVCEECNDYIPVNSASTTEDSYTLCDDCMENADRCFSCGDIYHHIDTYELYGNGEVGLCNSCLECYYSCTNCAVLVSEGRVEYLHDDPYCPDCLPDEDDKIIHDYDYKPEAVFYGPGSCYYGLELETGEGGEDEDNAETLQDIMGEGAYIKHDGSVSKGFEVVTHPMTYDYHVNTFPWRDVLKKAVSMGYTSHDNPTCGLHIHISRKAFGDNWQEQDKNILKLLLLFEIHWRRIVKLSRRTEKQLEDWAKNYGITDDSILPIAKGSGRYYAVNLQNDKTVEIRVFRGTLKYQSFIAALQFCHILIDIIKKESVDVRLITWQHIMDAGKGYQEFINYVNERGIK